MNATLEFVSGRCTNDLFCAVASAGDIVRVPLGARFVCSYCGGKLEEASAQPRRIGMRGGAIIGGSMAVTGIALFAIGFWIGAPPSPSATTSTSQPQPRQAAATVRTPSVVVAAAQLPPKAAPVAEALLPPTITMAQAPSVPAVAPKPLAVALAIAEAPIPAPAPLVERLRAPRARAEVIVPPPKPEPKLALAPPVPVTPALAPPGAPTQADQLNAKEAVNLEKPMPAPAPKLTAAAAGPTHNFVPQPIEGGGPVYPAAYDGGTRKGVVTVSCRIEVSGTPTGCRVLRAVGGEAFASEINDWLDSGHVRFAPIVRNGQAVAETHKWTVEFQPQS